MKVLALFNRLKSLPGGTRLFTLGVCRTAPYFSSISPLVEALEPGYARVSIRKRRRVENHLGTVHAIAMCNMAELAGGLMTDVSIPQGARWIPAGMTVEYRKKAMTDLVAEADGSGIDWNVSGDKQVPVTIKDKEGQTVFTANIRMNVKLA
ncbi:MAG: hotdog fold domain-containing protein [Pedobacter sp.]|nr:hotdog fold domain-containing protein [Pedobacter sp.]